MWYTLHGYDCKNVAFAKAGGIQNTFWGLDVIVVPKEPVFLKRGGAVLLSDEVREYCSEHKLLHHLQVALRLVQETFANPRSIYCAVQGDPEFEADWVVITVQLFGQVNDVLEMYEAYTRMLVETIPWPARDSIRLSYDIL